MHCNIILEELENHILSLIRNKNNDIVFFNEKLSHSRSEMDDVIYQSHIEQLDSTIFDLEEIIKKVTLLKKDNT